MAYLDSIPNATDILAISQVQLKENFSQLNTQFSIDHDVLTAGGATGKHLQAHFPIRAADATTIASEGAVYTKDSGTQLEFYFREESNGDVVQLTHGGYTNTFVKAFVTFNQTGIILGTAYNVTSVVPVGGYNFLVNFTTPMADALYTVIASVGGTARYYGIRIDVKTVNDVRVLIGCSGVPLDCNVVVYRVA